MEPNVIAFLKVIRACEGTDTSTGYRKIFGGELINDFSRHPNRSFVHNGVKTSPAGAYQIVYTTWVWLNGLISLPNFRPENQDRAAVRLLEYRKALKDVIAGRFDQAVAKCRKEWVSLPGASQAASGKTIASIKGIYTQAGGTLA